MATARFSPKGIVMAVASGAAGEVSIPGVTVCCVSTQLAHRQKPVTVNILQLRESSGDGALQAGQGPPEGRVVASIPAL